MGRLNATILRVMSARSYDAAARARRAGELLAVATLTPAAPRAEGVRQ
jgi:hypothetical protein